jgi:signal transduction histidine kinase
MLVTSTEPDPVQPPSGPRGPGAESDPRPERFTDDLIRPFVALTLIAVVAVEIPGRRLVAPGFSITLFVLVAALAIGTLFPWTRLPRWLQVALMGAYVVLASIMVPFTHATEAPVFAFVASAVAGGKLASRTAAIWVAVAGALSCAAAIRFAGTIDPVPGQWPWWVGLMVGTPVFIGISRRYRLDALYNARRAVAETERAAASEAREAALLERARIAREIHDVLGHSLSGIALQLDMADALAGSGRDDEAMLAVRKARSLAVDSIVETRRAVYALREDTLPLRESLRLLASGEAVPFEVTGDPGPVSVETSHTVIRVAQEALTNAAKYAYGAARTMTLAFTDDRVCLTVTNGPATTRPPAGVAGGTGIGLVGLRERAALLGGTLQAGPRDGAGGGWTVRLEVPR